MFSHGISSESYLAYARTSAGNVSVALQNDAAALLLDSRFVNYAAGAIRRIAALDFTSPVDLGVVHALQAFAQRNPRRVAGLRAAEMLRSGRELARRR